MCQPSGIPVANGFKAPPMWSQQPGFESSWNRRLFDYLFAILIKDFKKQKTYFDLVGIYATFIPLSEDMTEICKLYRSRLKSRGQNKPLRQAYLKEVDVNYDAVNKEYNSFDLAEFSTFSSDTFCVRRAPQTQFRHKEKWPFYRLWMCKKWKQCSAAWWPW